MSVMAVGFPNPVTWVWDKADALAGDAASSALGWSFEKVIGGLVAWVLDGVAWVVGAVFGFIDTSTSPAVTAAWFVGDGSRDGPYRMMVGVAASLLVLFVFAGLIQGVLNGDIGGIGRRMGLDLPVAIGGMVSTVAITQVVIDLTDAISAAILAGFGTDIRAFMDGIATVGQLTGGAATALVVFLLGLFTLLAGLVIFVELVIRSALIYLVVALCPLAFAALVWPATRGVLRKTLELLCALIVSKVVIALALAIGAAALGGAGNAPTAAPELAPPTATAGAAGTAGESDAATVTAAAGVLLAGLATFAVASFSPFVLLRLFPVAEAAIAAQGLRGGPVRAAQNAWSMKYKADVSRRFGSGPSGSGGGGTQGAGQSGAAGTGAAGSAGGAGGAAASPTAASASAAAGPAAAAVVATAGAARSATRRAGASAANQSTASPPPRPRTGGASDGHP